MHSTVMRINSSESHDNVTLENPTGVARHSVRCNVVHVQKRVSTGTRIHTRYLYSYLTRSKFNVCTPCQRPYMQSGITEDLKMQIQRRWVLPQARVPATLMSPTNLCVCRFIGIRVNKSDSRILQF